MSILSIFHKYICILRIPYYWLRHNTISIHSHIRNRVFLRNCKVGKYCYIGSGSTINDTVIGNYCSIAPNVQIGGMEHSYWTLSNSTFLSDECISGNVTHIGHDVWIGAGSIIKQGITIGEGAVIGANSFVNKDVQPYSIVAGSPAKLLKPRFEQKIIEQINNSQYWLYSPQKAKRILLKIKVNH